jgi:soluble lytic murein transglycosylase-like protein
MYYQWWSHGKKYDFIKKYTNEKVARSILKWSKYWELDKYWLEIFCLLMTESNGKQYATSNKNCKGYMQLGKTTYIVTKERLYKLIKNCNVYAIEFNIAGGILHLKNLMDHWCSNNWWITVEVYNTGWNSWANHKVRSPLHMKRYSINYTFYKTEWDKFSSLF